MLENKRRRLITCNAVDRWGHVAAAGAVRPLPPPRPFPRFPCAVHFDHPIALAFLPSACRRRRAPTAAGSPPRPSARAPASVPRGGKYWPVALHSTVEAAPRPNDARPGRYAGCQRRRSPPTGGAGGRCAPATSSPIDTDEHGALPACRGRRSTMRRRQPLGAARPHPPTGRRQPLGAARPHPPTGRHPPPPPGHRRMCSSWRPPPPPQRAS